MNPTCRCGRAFEPTASGRQNHKLVCGHSPAAERKPDQVDVELLDAHLDGSHAIRITPTCPRCPTTTPTVDRKTAATGDE